MALLAHPCGEEIPRNASGTTYSTRAFLTISNNRVTTRASIIAYHKALLRALQANQLAVGEVAVDAAGNCSRAGAALRVIEVVAIGAGQAYGGVVADQAILDDRPADDTAAIRVVIARVAFHAAGRGGASVAILAAVAAERADVVLDVVLVAGEGRAALLAVAVGNHVVGVAEVADAGRVAPYAVGKSDRAGNTGSIAEIPASFTLRAVGVGYADLAVGQQLCAGETIVEDSSVGGEEVAGVASGADSGRGAEDAVGDVLAAA